MTNADRAQLATDLLDLYNMLEEIVKSAHIPVPYDRLAIKHYLRRMGPIVNQASSVILPRGYKIVISRPTIEGRIS